MDSDAVDWPARLWDATSLVTHVNCNGVSREGPPWLCGRNVLKIGPLKKKSRDRAATGLLAPMCFNSFGGDHGRASQCFGSDDVSAYTIIVY